MDASLTPHDVKRVFPPVFGTDPSAWHTRLRYIPEGGLLPAAPPGNDRAHGLTPHQVLHACLLEIIGCPGARN